MVRRRCDRYATKMHQDHKLAVISTMALAFGFGALAAPVPAAAAPAAAAPFFCHGSAAIAATDVASPVSLGSCPIGGRTIVLSLPGGHTAGGVSVPAAARAGITSVRAPGGQ